MTKRKSKPKPETVMVPVEHLREVLNLARLTVMDLSSRVDQRDERIAELEAALTKAWERFDVQGDDLADELFEALRGGKAE